MNRPSTAAVTPVWHRGPGVHRCSSCITRVRPRVGRALERRPGGPEPQWNGGAAAGPAAASGSRAMELVWLRPAAQSPGGRLVVAARTLPLTPPQRDQAVDGPGPQPRRRLC